MLVALGLCLSEEVSPPCKATHHLVVKMAAVAFSLVLLVVSSFQLFCSVTRILMLCSSYLFFLVSQFHRFVVVHFSLCFSVGLLLSASATQCYSSVLVLSCVWCVPFFEKKGSGCILFVAWDLPSYVSN